MMHFVTFFIEYLFTLSVLAGFSFIGGFALLPFVKNFRYSIFMAPAAGLLVTIVAVSCSYNVLFLSVAKSLILTSFSGTLLTSFSLFRFYQSGSSLVWPDKRLIFIVLLVIAFIVLFSNFTTIIANQPGFYTDLELINLTTHILQTGLIHTLFLKQIMEN